MRGISSAYYERILRPNFSACEMKCGQDDEIQMPLIIGENVPVKQTIACLSKRKIKGFYALGFNLCTKDVQDDPSDLSEKSRLI